LKLRGKKDAAFGACRPSLDTGRTRKSLIGELTGANGRTVVIVDTDGYLNGQLVDDNTLSFCYTQAGGKSQSSVVSCTEIKRAP